MTHMSGRCFWCAIAINVLVYVPDVDRSKTDQLNLLGVTSELVDIEAQRIRVRTQHGKLQGVLSPNMYDVCKYDFLSLSDVREEPKLSIRSAAKADSITGGQGMLRCNCGASSRCQTARCKCFQHERKCNSRCHQSLACANK